MKKLVSISVAVAVLALVSAITSQAAIMIKPVGVTVSAGGYSGNYWDGHPDFTIDGSGLSGASVNTGDAIPGTMPTHAGAANGPGPTPAGGNFVLTHNTSGDGATGNLVWVLDLGAKYDLTGLDFWNWTRGDNSYPVKGLTLSTSATNGSFTNPNVLTMAGANSSSPEQFSITGSGVQYVQLSNWIASSPGNWMGVMEIRFEGTEASSAVPEPSTLLLLGLGGLSLIGVARRMRK